MLLFYILNRNKISSTISKKACYNTYGDNRIEKSEIYEYSWKFKNHTKISEVVKGICCFIKKEILRGPDENGYFKIKSNVATLAEDQESRFNSKFYEKEKFGNQKCAGFATGFLITTKKIMTAQHVIEKMDFSQYFVVFNFSAWRNNIVPIYYMELFSVEKVLKSSFESDTGEDWAICELDRKVSDHFFMPKPLTLNLNYRVKESDVFILAGHPSGLPLKIVPEGCVKPNKDGKKLLTQTKKIHTFQIEIAAFHGNSGSPILNDEGEVVGILIEGQHDYQIGKVPNKILCFDLGEKDAIISHKVTNEGIENKGYEIAQRIDTIRKFIEPFLKD